MRLPPRRLRRAILWIDVLLALAVAYVAFGGVPSAIDYYREVDASTIAVGYTGGFGWERLRVEETDDQVKVTVYLYQWPLPAASVGHPRELLLRLDAPLAGRTVLDAHLRTGIRHDECPPPAFGAPCA